MKRVLVTSPTKQRATHSGNGCLAMSSPERRFTQPSRARAPSDDQDWKLFLLSFTAFFTVAYSFIL